MPRTRLWLISPPLPSNCLVVNMLQGCWMPQELWPGDLTGDSKVIYQGPANDVFKLFYDIMSHPDNTTNLANFIRSGYEAADVNMDGNAIYQGPTNDRAMLSAAHHIGSPSQYAVLEQFCAFR